MNNIEKAVIKTLAFFDILGRPLLLEEIWHYLYREEASKIQVLMAIRKLVRTRKVGKDVSINTGHIYYYLNGRQEIVKQYFDHFEISLERWRKVRWTAKLLKHVPFIKNISVINSLSYNNSGEKSDIDILIITKKDKLWLTRALVVFLLEIIGQNKNKWYQANKFCLGFAFDETRLSLKKIKLAGEDIDLIYWFANLTPVFDRGIYKDLVSSNGWIKKDLPNWEEKAIQSGRLKTGRIEKMLSGRFGEKLESFLSKIQIKRIWSEPKNKRIGGSVVADKGMMKLHPYDIRRVRAIEWKNRVRDIIGD